MVAAQPIEPGEQGSSVECTLYQATNSGAHREPLTEVGAPALTWHRSFLIPKKLERDGKQGPLDAVEESLDRNILDAIAADSDEPQSRSRRTTRTNPEEVKAKLDELIGVFIGGLTGSFQTLPFADNKIILFTKLLDATTLKDVTSSPGRLEGILQPGERTFIIKMNWKCMQKDWAITVRVHVQTNIFSVTTVAEPVDESLSVPTDLVRWADKFWLRFAAFVQRREGLKACLNSPIFGCEFADIRGVILPSRSLGFDDEILPAGRTIPDWGKPVADQLRRLMMTGNRYELSVSYMLSRRALHLTALGPQPLGLSRHKKRPSVFVTCVLTRDRNEKSVVGRRQLGRLIDRMHFLGTMRLAAILDLQLLEKASQALSKIDDLKKTARACIQLFEKGKIEAEDTRSSLKQLRRALNKITSDFLENNPAGVGITFRIESSRYYVSQFRKNLKTLRLTRVESFQPYDQFVERRLGVTFESIDRLGIRYDRAMQEMEGIDRSFASIQARSTGNTVAEIQQLGELALLAVLVPYYLIATLGHIIDVEKDEHGLRREIIQEPTKRSIYTAIWVGMIMYGAYRFFFPKRLEAEWRPDIVAYGLLVFFLVFLAAWTFFNQHFAPPH